MEDLEDNDMLTKEQYLANPCKAASIPYWKAKSVTVPDSMKILHQDEYDDAGHPQYIDEPYFRMIHDLKGLSKPVLPLCSWQESSYVSPTSTHWKPPRACCRC